MRNVPACERGYGGTGLPSPRGPCYSPAVQPGNGLPGLARLPHFRNRPHAHGCVEDSRPVLHRHRVAVGRPESRRGGVIARGSLPPHGRRSADLDPCARRPALHPAATAVPVQAGGAADRPRTRRGRAGKNPDPHPGAGGTARDADRSHPDAGRTRPAPGEVKATTNRTNKTTADSHKKRE